MNQLGTITIQAPVEPFLTGAEVAKLLGVKTEKTIERWVEAVVFPPPLKQGRETVWSNLAIAAYMLWKQVGPQGTRAEASGSKHDESEE